VIKSYIKKNYTDPSAGFIYAIGSSLVHLCLFITSFAVIKPDVQAALELELKFISSAENVTEGHSTLCSNYAKYWRMLMIMAHWLHAVLVIVTIYVEVFSARVGTIGHFIRAGETFGSMCYLGLTIAFLGAFGNGLLIIDSPDHPPCAIDPVKFHSWAGTTQAFFMIEIGVFFFYLLTMMLLMAKSRCLRIGIDQQKQFEPIYLSKMINKIVENIPFDLLQVKRTHARTKKRLVNRVKIVNVEGVYLKLKLDEPTYDKMFKRLVLGEKDKIRPEESVEWIENCLLGNINKKLLDK